jgi:hypothetical protein
LNIIETLVSFGDQSEEQIPTSNTLMQLEDVCQEEWCKIPLQIVQNLYESIPRRIADVLKAEGGPTSY